MPWKRHLFVLGAAAVGVGVLTAYWSVASKPLQEPPAETEAPAPEPISKPFVTFVDPSKGPEDAKVTIVEFGDHACPYCRTTQQAVDRLMAEYPKDVRFVWKSAPTPLHVGADTAAEASLCAARQGRFWDYHAQLFEEQTLFDEASMAIHASELRLDLPAFNECLSTAATRPLVERTVTEARALGLTGIPTIFINDQRYEGAMTYEQLLEAAGL